MLTTKPNNAVTPLVSAPPAGYPENWDLYLAVDQIAKERQTRYQLLHFWEALTIDHFVPRNGTEALRFSIVVAAAAMTLYTHWMYDLRRAIVDAVQILLECADLLIPFSKLF